MHRYFFWLYALRKQLDLPAGASYEQLKSEMNAWIIEDAELIGTYARRGRTAA
jgi:phosphatidylethanolamine-binding protein (PEBP) family uncharacterized protein